MRSRHRLPELPVLKGTAPLGHYSDVTPRNTPLPSENTENPALWSNASGRKRPRDLGWLQTERPREAVGAPEALLSWSQPPPPRVFTQPTTSAGLQSNARVHDQGRAES